MTQQNTDEYGKVTFADEVIAIISGLAATEIAGVAGMSGGLAGGIVEMLGRKNLSKGVKVEVGDKETAIDLFIVADYGVRIPEMAWNIQENVKKAVENMTGLAVKEVNIHIQGVVFEKEKKEEAPSKVK